MANPTKTKEELERLILDEISNHPVCPPGMGVSVKTTGRGDWRADAIPPSGSHIAYTDCANYIGEVARRLRSQYDLMPDQLPVGGTDDAANIVVQQYADRQRRFVAATSSETTGPINPQGGEDLPESVFIDGPVFGRVVTRQEQPPQTTSITHAGVIGDQIADPLALHQQMLWRIEALEQAMANLSAMGMIGHNRPPEPIDPVPFNDEDRAVVEQAIVIFGGQPPRPPSPPGDAIQAAAQIKTLGERIRAYVAKQADVFVSEAVKKAGQEFGKRSVQLGVWLIVADQLIGLANAVRDWITALGWPAPF
jgi:hypothetical protein